MVTIVYRILPPAACLLAFLLGSVLAFGQDAPVQVRLDDAPPPTPAVCHHVQDPHRRAGCPQCVHRWAIPTKTSRYGGYYVGGGAPTFRGECRYVDEGTWGMDYVGWIFERRVWNNWWHGRRYQAGSGAYKTDGPNVLKKLHE